MLWENTFYEKGSEIGQRIAELCEQVDVDDLALLAVRARTDLKLRHVPLWLVRQMARLHQGSIVGDTLAAVIRRPDEMTEFLSMYWLDGRQPLSAQVKRGLAMAFGKFNEYQLAKWDRGDVIKLRDALFLCHAKPKDDEQEALWKRLIDGELEVPDTWEVALSSGDDKKATWERLLTEKKLGYMALLMNLRNMTEAGVDSALVEDAIINGATGSKALPFRFVSAAKHAPTYAEALSTGMVHAIDGHLAGNTAVVIDVSGSMSNSISARSTLRRWEAAAAVAVLIREIAPQCRVFTFSEKLVEVGNYRGLGLIAAVGQSQPMYGTYLRKALSTMSGQAEQESFDRVIVITDEQSHDGIFPAWTDKAYLINVAAYEPGLDMTQGWTRINGFSERVVEWMQIEESESDSQ
jgi:hypothetical protein